jgi:hypothetical protein
MGKPLRTIDPPCAIVIEAPFRSALQTRTARNDEWQIEGLS